MSELGNITSRRFTFFLAPVVLKDVDVDVVTSYIYLKLELRVKDNPDDPVPVSPSFLVIVESMGNTVTDFLMEASSFTGDPTVGPFTPVYNQSFLDSFTGSLVDFDVKPGGRAETNTGSYSNTDRYYRLSARPILPSDGTEGCQLKVSLVSTYDLTQL